MEMVIEVRASRALTMAMVLQLLIAIIPLATATALEFHHLNVHELVYATHRPPSTTLHDTPHSQDPVHERTRDEPKWALKLVHRDALLPVHDRRYRQRFLQRINRDALRVAGLARHLNRTAPPVRFALNDFGSAVVSGLDEGVGEYLVRVGIGMPEREHYLVVDTGSDVTWVQCRPCSQCYDQAEPVFDPAGSASFEGVSCGSTVCGLVNRADPCRSDRCRYAVAYEDGSYTKGTLAFETLTFGPTHVQNVAIGCGHTNHGLFNWASGLLGLGAGPLSLVGQLGPQTGGAFGYCLVSRGAGPYGSLVFGRTAAVPRGAAWVPLLTNPQAPSFYYIALLGLGVGGVRLPVPEQVFQLAENGEGGVIVDTGTAVTRFPPQAYEVLRDAFVDATEGLPRGPTVSIFDACYDLSGFGTVRVPTVSLYFDGGVVLTLPARNYLVPVDGVGTFCLAFAPSSSGLSIVGNIQQEGIQMIAFACG
ncbi:protein ASPARTIC PROTEASE IN GUARD CELL 2-like [Ananas comosus]|uniref:Protein ASPARTIC PROTEASE IN GUARD CELL 2-like n=1 Tax=Ananas comosus TaxID=4615 RepID=A0A6P5EW46_ANACO|nr:protein ASPARTIC PROTEASE IN GUARD CELL 2-like [Ananas comosus]